MIPWVVLDADEPDEDTLALRLLALEGVEWTIIANMQPRIVPWWLYEIHD